MRRIRTVSIDVNVAGEERARVMGTARALCEVVLALEAVGDLTAREVAAAIAEALARQLERVPDDEARAKLTAEMCDLVTGRVTEIRAHRLAAMLASADGAVH